MEGWIKLHRKFTEWEWFNTDNMVKLFIFLLLNANHKDNTWQGIEIKRGQYLTGLNSLSEKTKISIQTLRTCLKRLEKTQEINSKVTNKYRILTICNYDSYQESQQATNKQPNKQLTSNQQATNKQLTANKNDKKEKNDKNDSSSITTAIEILNILKSISNEKLNEMKELTLFNGDILELSKKFAVEFIGRYGLNKTKPEVIECFQSWMHKDKNIIKSKEEEVTINMSEVGNGKLTRR